MKFLSILLFPIFFSCQNGQSNTAAKKYTDTIAVDSVPAKTLAGNFSTQTSLMFDSSAIPAFLNEYPQFKTYGNDYLKFYSARKYAYAWHHPDGNPIEQSTILYNFVFHIDQNGLPIEIPYPDAYTNLMENHSRDSMLHRELMITGQYLVYARKVLTGIPEEGTKAINWYIPRKKIEYTALLDSLLTGNTTALTKMVFPQYYLLRDKLKEYDKIDKSNSVITLEANVKKYQLGDSSPTIAQIRKRLFLVGDIPSDNGSAMFDSVIYKGIMGFQSRYGIRQDGVAGPGVLREMSAPVAKRMEQIMVNMERCRWIPDESSDTWLVVNIPQFELMLHSKNAITWTCPVVVGKEANKTAIFKGDMKYVVFSPYWNVPQSILKKEVIPGMKRNSNYLQKHNMEWNNGNVRQRPGPNNSLGLVKFLFPNSFDIYLHDTPSKSLFKEDRRAFSHGCIRVSEPRKLASLLLSDSPGWTDQKIGEAMNKGKEQYVTLKKTVPVYLVYFTAFVDTRGKLNFREDIYHRDNVLKDMILAKNSQKSAQ